MTMGHIFIYAYVRESKTYSTILYDKEKAKWMPRPEPTTI